MKHFNKQKGVSLYIAIMIISILLAIVLGSSAILLGQLKVIKGMENSIIAFYAADSGIERILMDRADPTLSPVFFECPCGGPVVCTLGNNINYCVDAQSLSAPDNFYIRSVGEYKGTKRAIEVVY